MMHQEWQDFLTSTGATIEEGRVTRIGDQITANTAPDQTWLCDLSPLGLIHFAGEDTTTFLNGQLSSDIKKLGATECVYSSQSTPKGRVMANFRIWQQSEGYMLQLPAALKAAIQKRLSMYILRAKSKASTLPDSLITLGLIGPAATTLCESLVGSIPAPMNTTSKDHITCVALTSHQFMLILPLSEASSVWQQLSATASPAPFAQWELAEIQQGTPWVTTENQEEFVAQMLNLDLLPGGISFTKGCYTGQEIIARTQYLGKLKRRTYRLHSDAQLTAGDQLYSEEMNGQASGRIVNAVATDKGWEALAVIQSTSLEQELHIGELTGPTVQLLALPYSLEAAS